jgi:hypothetical protein
MADWSLTFALGSWRVEATATAHALPKALALFGSHALPAFAHSTSEMRAPESVASKAAEQYPAQHQNAQRLREIDLAPPKQCR